MLFGINSSAVKARIKKAEKFERAGVTVVDPITFFVSGEARIGEGAVISPFVTLVGKCVIGKKVKILSGCFLENAIIGDNCVIEDSRIIDSTVGISITNKRASESDSFHANTEIISSRVISSTIGEGVTVGPYAFIRGQAEIGDNCRIGDYVEIKNSKIGAGTKSAHLAYIGDANVGEGCNIGCGAVFVNYNGIIKKNINVGDNVFIGSNVNLVAPVNIASGAYIAAGSTVTVDLHEDDFCIARSREYIKAKGAKGRYPKK